MVRPEWSSPRFEGDDTQSRREFLLSLKNLPSAVDPPASELDEARHLPDRCPRRHAGEHDAPPVSEEAHAGHRAGVKWINQPL